MRKRALAAVFFILAALPLAVGCPVVTAFILPHWRSGWERCVVCVFGIASPDTLAAIRGKRFARACAHERRTGVVRSPCLVRPGLNQGAT